MAACWTEVETHTLVL